MIQHFFPADSDVVSDPDVTLLIPSLNEEITIAEFVTWCKKGFEDAGVKGQLLIVDSSTDKTPEIALAYGAEVLSVPKLGLGRAYIDAIPYVRSRFVIMGDADLTYDMRLIKAFIEKYKQGYEFIMGSRFKGSIEKGAMPALHQYFGTPLTTFILNIVYARRFSDIHCGMRGVTLDALKRMRLHSQGWQYASEMIIKASHLDLKCTEIPVNFYKDREGRLSHHKRAGWYAPWVAGWINLKAILIFGADFFLYKLGITMCFLGLIGVASLYNGPFMIGKIGFSLHWMLFFLLIFLVGLQFFFMGVLAKVIYDVEMRRLNRWKSFFSLDIVILLGALFVVLGVFSAAPLVMTYINSDLSLPVSLAKASYRAVAGVGLVFSGVIYFASALIFNAVISMHSVSGSKLQL